MAVTLREFLETAVLRHRKGWTGALRILSCSAVAQRSHGVELQLHVEVIQHAYTSDGRYVEDPWVNDLQELEVMEGTVEE